MEVPVFEAGNQLRPAEIAKRGLAEGKKQGIDVIIVDTAGRLQVLHLPVVAKDSSFEYTLYWVC